MRNPLIRFYVKRLLSKKVQLIAELTTAKAEAERKFQEYQEVHQRQLEIGYTRKQAGYFTEFDRDSWTRSSDYVRYLEKKLSKVEQKLARYGDTRFID